jgi:hypothetical protein
MAEVQAFFDEALVAAKKIEPIIETGNKYGVSVDFGKLNGEILFHQVQTSPNYQALSEKDKARANEVFSLMCFNGDLRNRNPLHPTPLDSAVIGNLMNFPKHIFGFPFAGWCTNGHEAMSLCFYSYRQECKSSSPTVLYVLAEGEEEPLPAIGQCCARLQMKFTVLKENTLHSTKTDDVALVMTNFTNPALDKVSHWAGQKGLHVHIHLLDSQFRDIFASNSEPVHFKLPTGIRSMSLHDGLFNSGFQLYADTRLRDLHFDLPYFWQTAYMSPNEGGSGNSTPLFIDFCFVLLGWSAMRDMATKAVHEKKSEPLQPLKLGTYLSGDDVVPAPQGTFEDILSWAKTNMDQPREKLERCLVEFQRNFVGGKGREVEAVVTSGGTRSINFTFESILYRAQKALNLPASKCKVITGNPHLAVERAERRLQFQVIRVEDDGMLSVEGLKREIVDPAVVAVYAQSLSFTDGITDPLPDILNAIEDENKRRQTTGGMPVTLINDSCLALSILIHNDGRNGAPSMRVLDLSEGYITPTIVMLDAHKHLGADKGISMTMGTPGTLSHLTGHVRVGAAPSKGELVRAMADLSFIGVEGYYNKYHELVAAVDNALQTMESNGMKVIHSHNRAKGSTVFAVEDPGAVLGKALKKKGHGTAPIYQVAPTSPDRVQSGFQLSLTLNALRPVKEGKPALDVFTGDVVEIQKAVQSSQTALANMFKESSLPGYLVRGGDESFWLFALLQKPGFGREAVSLILRRLYSAILDSGVACSNRTMDPLNIVVKRVFGVGILQVLALIVLGRRFRRRSKI